MQRPYFTLKRFNFYVRNIILNDGSTCTFVAAGCEWDLFMDPRDYVGAVVIIYKPSKDASVTAKFKNTENSISL